MEQASKNNKSQPKTQSESNRDTQFSAVNPTIPTQSQQEIHAKQGLYSPEWPIILDQRKATVVGIIGILLPLGIQDFATKRYSWGFCHLLSPILAIVGFLLWTFDGYCAGGKICSSPPSVGAIIGSFFLSSAIVLVILNLFECVRLMATRTIEYSKKSFNIVFNLSIVVLTVLLFVFRVWSYYH